MTLAQLQAITKPYEKQVERVARKLARALADKGVRYGSPSLLAAGAGVSSVFNLELLFAAMSEMSSRKTAAVKGA